MVGPHINKATSMLFSLAHFAPNPLRYERARAYHSYEGRRKNRKSRYGSSLVRWAGGSLFSLPNKQVEHAHTFQVKSPPRFVLDGFLHSILQVTAR